MEPATSARRCVGDRVLSDGVAKALADATVVTANLHLRGHPGQVPVRSCSDPRDGPGVGRPQHALQCARATLGEDHGRRTSAYCETEQPARRTWQSTWSRQAPSAARRGGRARHDRTVHQQGTVAPRMPACPWRQGTIFERFAGLIADDQQSRRPGCLRCGATIMPWAASGGGALPYPCIRRLTSSKRPDTSARPCACGRTQPAGLPRVHGGS